jgi:hypothetical protein
MLHRLLSLPIVVLSTALWLSVATAQTQAQQMDVKKTATCGCCNAWIEHLETAGIEVRSENLPASILSRFKIDNGIPARLASCHTGMIGGYVIEGHVPAREIQRLLKENPDAIGLSVPGMPLGSPGMEAGDMRDAYDVLLLAKDGTTTVFAHYPATK